jgi:hypothetical protein
MKALDDICHYIGQLEISDAIPEEIDRHDVFNKAVDVRSAAMLYIALQIQRDTSALGIIGFGSKFWSQVC